MNKRAAGLIVNLIMLAAAVVAYPHLPAEIPTHWDFHGDVNGTMAKFPGAFLPSLIALGIWILLPLLRGIDPRKASYEKFDATFYLIINVVVLLMALLQGLMLAVGLGVHVDMLRAMLFGVGLMFAIMGNYMPRIRSNWWMGVRTPWTLDNEEVWRRTHRFAGRTFVMGGVITMLSVALPGEAARVIALVSMMIAGLVPVVYSYVIWRHEPSRVGERTDA